MLKTITKNPLPAALVGLGMYWLLKNPSEEKLNFSQASTPYRPHDNGHFSSDSSMEEQVKEGFQPAKETVQDHLYEWKDQAGHQAQEWKEQVSQQAQQWKEQASHKAQMFKEETGQKMEEVKGYLQQQSAVARNEFNHLMETHPLAVGAVMLAIGAAVAAALPGSRREDQWMGGPRDEMIKTVKAKVQSTVEDVAHTTGQAAQTAFKNEIDRPD